MCQTYDCQKDFLQAAKALSCKLDDLGLRHAFIGGFACSLLGSPRLTKDIDVIIETQRIDLVALCESLAEVTSRFATLNFQLYYIQNVSEGIGREELVLRSSENVLVKAFPAGLLGLPIVAELTLEVGNHAIKILHPSVLILTKFKRWSASHASTHPKTIRKILPDVCDIVFLIIWLAERGISIRFESYCGTTKPELLLMVRRFRDKYAEETERMESLRSIMPDDWDAMLALLAPEDDSRVPPVHLSQGR
ncbi:hypothetical protein CERSUDRAFT_151359 [Gelatoporia subvermispora B]|uniref:Uncharacterized protein n=1 Tax=Ceriporiopsis subvermispora (strain B) TaxID=914234 RepID=M2QNV2_CERS8|nr:hypothetical protein CERSUDRAFT_151359 [Gelatoporia subvermispora B]